MRKTAPAHALTYVHAGDADAEACERWQEKGRRLLQSERLATRGAGVHPRLSEDGDVAVPRSLQARRESWRTCKSKVQRAAYVADSTLLAMHTSQAVSASSAACTVRPPAEAAAMSGACTRLRA